MIVTLITLEMGWVESRDMADSRKPLGGVRWISSCIFTIYVLPYHDIM
jgi:hypothetical protein